MKTGGTPCQGVVGPADHALAGRATHSLHSTPLHPGATRDPFSEPTNPRGEDVAPNEPNIGGDGPSFTARRRRSAPSRRESKPLRGVVAEKRTQHWEVWGIGKGDRGWTGDAGCWPAAARNEPKEGARHRGAERTERGVGGGGQGLPGDRVGAERTEGRACRAQNGPDRGEGRRAFGGDGGWARGDGGWRTSARNEPNGAMEGVGKVCRRWELARVGWLSRRSRRRGVAPCRS
jgi:hypothetical protein